MTLPITEPRPVPGPEQQPWPTEPEPTPQRDDPPQPFELPPTSPSPGIVA